jgi:hypothetical protein
VITAERKKPPSLIQIASTKYGMVKTSHAAEAASQPRPTRQSITMSRNARKTNKRSSHHHSTAVTEDTNDVSNAQSASLGSDMSADECDKTPTKSANKQQSSVVHGFAIKKSPNEYVCNICSKV